MDKQAVAIASATTKVCEAFIDTPEENKQLRKDINIFFDRLISVEDCYGYWDVDQQIRVIPISAIDNWVKEFQDAVRRK